MHALRSAVTRHMRDGGEVLGPDQRIGVEDALKAITVNSAWQIFEEDRLANITIVKTYLDGKAALR